MIIALLALVLFWLLFRRWFWFFFGLGVAFFLIAMASGAGASATIAHGPCAGMETPLFRIMP